MSLKRADSFGNFPYPQVRKSGNQTIIEYSEEEREDALAYDVPIILTSEQQHEQLLSKAGEPHYEHFYDRVDDISNSDFGIKGAEGYYSHKNPKKPKTGCFRRAK